MDSFEQLSRRTQLGHMRQLARTALAAYDLPPFHLTLLAHLFNTTFRIDTATGDRYVLRIGRAGTPTVETVGSELEWLLALRRDTRLEVPSPVPTRAGRFLTVASAPGVSRPQICVLFCWLPGRLLRKGLTPRHMERVGELMAQLQKHAAEWQRPPGFTRGRVDYPIASAKGLADPFAPQVIESIVALVASTLSLVEAEQVAGVLARVRAVEEELGQKQDAFGLIHADLHYNNALVARGTVRAIDFDDCGFGPLLYDHAVMLSSIHGRPEYSALRAALLSGFRRVRPLPAEHDAYLDAFIALRHVQDALWMLEAREHPAITGDWKSQARRTLAPAVDWAAGTNLD